MTTRRVNLNTESVDNYLKAIFALGGQEEERVTSNALAEWLGVAPASITNMLQKLAASSPSLVKYERHRGVRLSAAGRRRALEVLRHHRLLETFLYEVLEYSLEEVQHFISERFEERIAAKLGHPKFDPHGHCIPEMDGRMPNQVSRPLTDIEQDGKFLVDSVSDQDPLLLKQLKAHGITPGARLHITRPSQEEFVLRAGSISKALRLSRTHAGTVRVRSD
jgi:DtxR family Mn-dependent transcriptional regulator